MDYKIPRGTFDILPRQSHKWQLMISNFREFAESFGYEEITTPIFEQAELFERSSGESSDVVKKEMYRFTDQKGRVFALRPEGTAPVVRSYVENRLDIGSPRTKLYYLGPMFRYDRPQAGRYRQFYQYGVEFIGSDHPYYDAEVIALLWDYLLGGGLRQMRLELNSVGCPACSKTYEQALRDYFRPHLNKLCGDCQTRFELKPRRLLDCKVPSCIQIAKDAPVQLDYLDKPCRDHFSEVQKYLELMSIPFTINPRIVRGLDYYTNTAFEVIYEGLGAQNSLAGGGRYNSLVEQIGGRSVPAIGFAGGFERLLLALDKDGVNWGEPRRVDMYLVTLGEAARTKLLPWLNVLRSKGFKVEYDPEKTSLQAQLKAANNLGAEYAFIVGDNEIERDTIVLKNLDSGEQETLPFEVWIRGLEKFQR